MRNEFSVHVNFLSYFYFPSTNELEARAGMTRLKQKASVFKTEDFDKQLYNFLSYFLLKGR